MFISKDILKIGFILSFLFAAFTSHSQSSPCDDTIAYEFGSTSQSTTLQNKYADYAYDGQTFGKRARTKDQNVPWWNLNLNGEYYINTIQMYVPENAITNPKYGLGDFYIFISKISMDNLSLENIIASPDVTTIHVTDYVQNGQAIELPSIEGRYVRIQSTIYDGFTDIKEVRIIGGPSDNEEICGNGKDDDCDGKTDCEDSDCAGIIQNVTVVNHPSAPIYDDGVISIQAFGNITEYSIDDGETYLPFCSSGGSCEISGLGQGSYNIFMKSFYGCITEYINNPVLLSAPAGGSHGHCPNGGFEDDEDNFVNWTLSYSDNSTQPIPNYEENVNLLRFAAELNDPIVEEFNNNYFPALGTYTLRLGDLVGGKNWAEATYCFDVDADDSDFHFFYAFVLFKSTHTDQDGMDSNPSFSYSIYPSSNINSPICSETYFTDDERLIDITVPHDPPGEGSNPWVYKPWTCGSCDLSHVIGQEICITFRSSDCTEGQHQGWAYIDALCAEDLEPVAEMTINEIYCGNQNVNIDVSGGGYNFYTWTIGKISNTGNQFDIHEFERIEHDNASLEDILLDYVDDSGYNADCGIDYIVSVRLENDCAETTIFGEFYLECDEIKVDYCNNLFYNGIESTFIGDFECDGCTYQWGLEESWLDVGNMLLDPNVKYPILDETNALSTNLEYLVTVTAPNGCIEHDKVRVYPQNFLHFSFSLEEETHCDFTFHVTIKYSNTIEISPFIPTIIDVNNIGSNGENVVYDNGQFVEEIIGDPHNEVTYSFTIAKDVENTMDLKIQTVPNPLNGEEYCCLNESMICGLDMGMFNNSIFHRPSRVYMPNTFSPNSENIVDQTIHPFFAALISEVSCEDGDYSENSSVYYAEFNIFHDRLSYLGKDCFCSIRCI